MEILLIASAIIQLIVLVWFIATLNAILNALKGLNQRLREFQQAMIDLSRRGVLELRELNEKRSSAGSKS